MIVVLYTSNTHFAITYLQFFNVLCLLKLTSGYVGAKCPLLTLEYFKALHILEVSQFGNIYMKFMI